MSPPSSKRMSATVDGVRSVVDRPPKSRCLTFGIELAGGLLKTAGENIRLSGFPCGILDGISGTLFRTIAQGPAGPEEPGDEPGPTARWQSLRTAKPRGVWSPGSAQRRGCRRYRLSPNAQLTHCTGCACRKSNSHIQMKKSAKKWRRQNATNGMYGSRATARPC